MKPNICLQIVLLAAAAALAACSAGSERAAPPDVAHDATAADWRADFDRLPDDIPRAAGFLEWAVLHVRSYDADGSRRIRAEALLPNERTAVIDARPEGDDGIRVAVHIGAAGDPAREKQFLDALRRSLNMKPVEK